MCVTPFTHLEAAYSSELLRWLQSHQTKALSPSLSPLRLSLSLSFSFSLSPSPPPSLPPPPNSPLFLSSLSIQLCNSIYHFIFSFISLFFHSTLVHFQSYLKTLLFPPLVETFLLPSETCLYKVNLPLTKGCPSASLGVFEKRFEKCVERIKVRPGARTSSFYPSILDSWAPKHKTNRCTRTCPPSLCILLNKLTQWNSNKTFLDCSWHHVSGRCIVFRLHWLCSAILKYDV